jgi:type VI secretion system protein VasD
MKQSKPASRPRVFLGQAFGRWLLARIKPASRAALTASVLGLSACGSPPPAEEPAETCDVQMITVALMANCINRTQQGEARPVQLRIYQLKSDVKLQNAGFQEVWKADADTLGEDLVSVQELPVYPRTVSDFKVERSEDARFIAAAAMFREPKGRGWYTIFELPPSPADGACGLIECEGEDCADAPIYDPKFAFWLDEANVEDGTPYADFDPSGKDQCIQAVRRPGPTTAQPTTAFEKQQAKESSGSGLPSADDIPKAPDVPDAPKAPEAPSAPKLP